MVVRDGEARLADRVARLAAGEEPCQVGMAAAMAGEVLAVARAGTVAAAARAAR